MVTQAQIRLPCRVAGADRRSGRAGRDFVIGFRRQAGVLTTDLVVAMGILAIAVLPLLTVFVQTQKAARVSYQRAVAMEIIDGEMEVLMAGEWRQFNQGAQAYPLHATALKNLPPTGKAILTIKGKHMRLEWLPGRKDTGGPVVREANAR